MKWYSWVIIVVLALVAGVLLFRNRSLVNDKKALEEGAAASSPTAVVNTPGASADANVAAVTPTPVTWQSATYTEGGSGPVDPSKGFDTNQTVVNHDNRLIVENPELDVRACFPGVDDAGWQSIADWAARWSDASPTRIEWQVVESRCSFVFPGNITDSISEKDYSDLLSIFTKYGYADTWFVGGQEGSEYGRKTYSEIITVNPNINRVHVYGPKLPAMPTVSK